MINSISKQILSEHQYLLNFCDLIETCLRETIHNHDNNHKHLLEVVQNLRELFNNHLPKDKILTNSITTPDDNKQWKRLLMDFQYPTLLKDFNQLNRILNSASKGHTVNEDYLAVITHNAIQQLRLTISIEEQFFLPYAQEDDQQSTD